MKLYMRGIKGTDGVELRSEDGGYTCIGPVAQMCDEEDAYTWGLDMNKWCVISMGDIYEVESLEAGLATIDAEIIAED